MLPWLAPAECPAPHSLASHYVVLEALLFMRMLCISARRDISGLDVVALDAGDHNAVNELQEDLGEIVLVKSVMR